MSAIVTDMHAARAASHPVDIIRDSILWVRAADIFVRLGSRGVVCASISRPRWSKDPACRGVDPLGAVLLHLQPELGDEERGLEEVLNAPLPWVLAFQAGLYAEDFTRSWADALDVRLRVAAYTHGLRFREEFIRTRPAEVRPS